MKYSFTSSAKAYWVGSKGLHQEIFFAGEFFLITQNSQIGRYKKYSSGV